MTECCGGLATLPIEQLDQYQEVPSGTTAHATSKGRRCGIESINNNLKPNEGLNRDILAEHGLAAHRFAVAILVFAHNFEFMMNDPEPVAEDEDEAEVEVEPAEFPAAADEVPESVEPATEADELAHPPTPTWLATHHRISPSGAPARPFRVSAQTSLLVIARSVRRRGFGTPIRPLGSVQPTN